VTLAAASTKGGPVVCWDTFPDQESLDQGSRMLKKIARFLLEPFTKAFRKFFDPRFARMEQGITTTNNTIEAILVRDVDVRDAITMTNRRIGDLEIDVRDIHDKLDFLVQGLAALHPTAESLPRSLAVHTSIDDITGGDAALLNFSESHLGYRSQAGLWFNPPDVVHYTADGVELLAMTERSIEVPFVLSAIAALGDNVSSVLDVGCAESLVPFELASLGYEVTGIDLREYPVEHPNLTTHAIPLEDWETEDRFDVIVCLSSIEHFGLGTYGEVEADERLDRTAMRLLLDRIKPNGSLVMTIPYGQTDITPVQRMYTREDIEALLDGWVIDTFAVAVPAGDGWVIADEIPEPAPTTDPPVTRQVAFITAHPDV